MYFGNVDSGVTLNYLTQVLKQRKPKSVRIATLLDKPVAVADPDNPAVIVDPEKATQGKEAARQNEEAGRPFWQLDPENRPATFAERAEAEANQK